MDTHIRLIEPVTRTVVEELESNTEKKFNKLNLDISKISKTISENEIKNLSTISDIYSTVKLLSQIAKEADKALDARFTAKCSRLKFWIIALAISNSLSWIALILQIILS